MKVYIYSIPRESAQGLHKWTSDGGQKLAKTKNGRAADRLMALYSHRRGGLLNYISYQPWIEDGKQKKDSKGHPLTLQHKLEEKWGKPEGFFSAMLGSTEVHDPSLMTYFQTKAWKLNEGVTILDTNNMDDEMFYYVCLDSPLVANSEKEWRSHKWPRAEYYIAVADESDEIKFKKSYREDLAVAKLQSQDLLPEDKRKLVTLLSLTSSPKNELTPYQVYNVLRDYITAGTTSNVDKFLELVTLAETQAERPTFEARYLLKAAVDLRIITEKADSFTWPRQAGSIVIGETFREAVDFILNPKKSALVEELNALVKSKSV